MARCTKCGRQGNLTDGLCGVCRSGVTYHYVEQRAKKSASRRKRIRALLGALYPEDKPLRRKQTLIVVIAAALLVTALLLLRPKAPVDDGPAGAPYGEETNQQE